MPSDDRQQSFDRALASHLRADGSRELSAAACSDAETLAAYHEGSLAPEQIALLKTHLATCQRCQYVLTNVQATDEIPLAMAPIPQPAPASISPAPTRQPVRVFPARKPVIWRWLAPAGALAAALVIWVAVQQNSGLLHMTTPKLASADPNANSAHREPTNSVPPSTRAPAASLPSSPTNSRRDAAATDTLSAATNVPSAPSMPHPTARSLAKQKSAPPAPQNLSADNNLNAIAEFSPAFTGSPRAKKDLKSLPASTYTGSASAADSFDGASAQSTKKSESSQLRSRAREFQPAVAGAPPAESSAAPSARAQAAKQPAAVDGVIQNEQMNERSRFSQAELRLANSIGDVTVSAPGERVSWRIGQAGAIGFSSDNGKTWTVQPSGVISDLLAGSAPSDQVCWIVGRTGTILRTTDSGAHWQKVSPPAYNDFRSVFAVNARQVTLSDSLASYQTTDAGATWHKVPTE